MGNRKISNLLIEISRKFNRVEDFFRYSRFMLDCLDIIKDDCPDVVKKSLAIAEGFFAGRNSIDELTSARVACWEFLNKKKKNRGSRKIENCQVRSAICALYPSYDPDDFFEVLNWFCEHFCETGNYENVVLEKLERNFDVG